MRPTKPLACTKCSRAFVAGSYDAKYCPVCLRKIKAETARRLSAEKRRQRQEKRWSAADEARLEQRMDEYWERVKCETPRPAQSAIAGFGGMA